jgi:hypothetical protein
MARAACKFIVHFSMSFCTTERNKHLGQIAEHTKPSTTVAEKNAAKLRKYIGQMASVFTNSGQMTVTPQIVEVNEDNIVSLFVPMSMHSSSAEVLMVDCEEVEIVEFPHGSCPIRMTVNKLYVSTGTTASLSIPNNLTTYSRAQAPHLT